MKGMVPMWLVIAIITAVLVFMVSFAYWDPLSVAVQKSSTQNINDIMSGGANAAGSSGFVLSTSDLDRASALQGFVP